MRLVHLVGDDDADAGLADGGFGFLGGFAHDGNRCGVNDVDQARAYFAVRAVRTRAISRRTDLDAGGVLKLAGGLLEAEVEGLLLEVAQAER